MEQSQSSRAVVPWGGFLFGRILPNCSCGVVPPAMLRFSRGNPSSCMFSGESLETALKRFIWASGFGRCSGMDAG